MDYFILGQVIEAANVPKDIDLYECNPDDVKMCKLEYGIATGQFLGLYTTVGLIVVRGNSDETFLTIGMIKKNQNFLSEEVNQYLNNIRRMPIDVTQKDE